MIRFPYRYRFKFPFLSDFFSENRNGFCPKSVQKVDRKKWHGLLADKQTDRQNRADREQLRDHVLDSQNADTARRCLKKLSPKPSWNPARIPACLGRCTLLKWRLRRNKRQDALVGKGPIHGLHNAGLLADA